VLLTGCAAIQRSEARSTGQLLAAAGFVMRPADTAERQQHLAALQCLYVGGSKEYSEHQRLRVQRQIAADQAWAAQQAQMDWGMWGPWW
jgi:hypothetical protein